MILDILRSFLAWCPGAFGILIRQKLYPFFLGSCGKGVLFGRFVEFKNSQNIHIADNAVISNRCRLSAETGNMGTGDISIEDNVFLGIGTLLRVESGSILVKKGTNVGSDCRIVSKNSILIGSNVLIAAYCTIGEGTSSPEKKSISGPTVIGDDVWLGARSHVFPAVHIGEGAIVGAHSVVEKNVTPYVVALGCPALTVKKRI